MSYPLVYELNTRCWLHDLSVACGKRCILDQVSDAELARWQQQGITHVWLMGIWSVGTHSRRFSQQQPQLLRAGADLFMDFQVQDLDGSPFAIAGYRVSHRVGGSDALARFRERLAGHGLGLILDFIPNHTGLDHAWLAENPGLYVSSAEKAPGTFPLISGEGKRWIAHGRDPFFPPWSDTAQLDYRNQATRSAVIGELQSVLNQCDGVRCDLAMLVLNEVFARTWADFPSAQEMPGSEFWAEAIAAVRQSHPHALLVAEAYWDLEPRLLELGFDFTYDKRLYDYLVARHPFTVQKHLGSVSPEFLAHSVHFLENHDELRIASVLAGPEHRAAALLTLGLPGARLLHEGQLTGATRALPVQFQRRPAEPPDTEIAGFYQRLLEALPTTAVGRGGGELLKARPAWPDNSTHTNFVLIQWRKDSVAFDLVVVNLAEHPSQCYASLAAPGLAEHNWSMVDLLGEQTYERRGDDLAREGLYLDLRPHGTQLFHFSPIA